jgi:hypothetical protein
MWQGEVVVKGQMLHMNQKYEIFWMKSKENIDLKQEKDNSECHFMIKSSCLSRRRHGNTAT